MDHVDGDQLCIRQRLWWARLTRADLKTANDILATTNGDITLIALGGGTLWWAGGYLVLTALISLVAVVTMPRFIGWRPAWAADAPW